MKKSLLNRMLFISLLMGLFPIAGMNLFGQEAEGIANYPGIPDGYALIYEQDFEKPQAIHDFEMSDPTAWKISLDGENRVLELAGESQYRARVRSPFNIALLKTPLLGDFIMEVVLAQTGREYGHRDLCLFFCAKDPTNYYYVHIASVADDHANNIFLVNDEPRVKIASKTTDGTDWGETGSWHKVRIKREMESGHIQVFFDDMSVPIMEATDQHFDIGRIGLGSFDDTGRFDLLRIWAPEIKEAQNTFFGAQN